MYKKLALNVQKLALNVQKLVLYVHECCVCELVNSRI